jgi:hypothetical protein
MMYKRPTDFDHSDLEAMDIDKLLGLDNEAAAEIERLKDLMESIKSERRQRINPILRRRIKESRAAKKRRDAEGLA